MGGGEAEGENLAVGGAGCGCGGGYGGYCTSGGFGCGFDALGWVSRIGWWRVRGEECTDIVVVEAARGSRWSNAAISCSASDEDASASRCASRLGVQTAWKVLRFLLGHDLMVA